MTMRANKVWPLSALGFAVFVGWAAWQRDAASQLQAGPAYAPVGVSASGNGSTAWFHHPASGRVVACVSVPGGAGVQCTEGRLP